jgi:hypothetical protein
MKLPTAQGVQAVAPVTDETVPKPHCKHAELELPVLLLKVPAAHFVQKEREDWLENEPGPHETHELAPSSEYCPG